MERARVMVQKFEHPNGKELMYLIVEKRSKRVAINIGKKNFDQLQELLETDAVVDEIFETVEEAIPVVETIVNTLKGKK